MAEVQQSSYEEIPYSSNPFYYTHPDNLGTVAMLMARTSVDCGSRV